MKKILKYTAFSGLVVLGLALFASGAFACVKDIPGCTDPQADNYNSQANIDDGSCVYEIPGCTDSSANNYNPDATTDDGTCQYDVLGCTDPDALNYNLSANIDDGSCQYPEPENLTIKAYKVVCDNESDLPNWTNGGAPSMINENTASDYVSQSQGACHLESGWDFQWGYGDKTGIPGAQKFSGDYIGFAPTGDDYGDWKDFDSSTNENEKPAMVQINDLQSTPRIWVREVLKDGYIPFTNPPKGVKEDNVSAEMYCHNDILNYDNYDYIVSPLLGSTYYCIAFNTLKETSGCTDPGANNYNPDADTDDGTCQYDIPGCTDLAALNYDSSATVDDGSCQYSGSDTFSISGIKFNDENNNGVNDQEPVLSDWTIELYLSDQLSESVATDSNGSYSFSNLDPGIYNVCEVNKTGWTQTYPTDNSGCHTIEVVDVSVLGVDFGNHQNQISGCTDPQADNYNSDANIDDGSCVYEIPGCTDSSANNYNSSATIDDGSCAYGGGGGSMRPRFSISKTVNEDFINPGGTAVYTIIVECLGSGIARDVVLTDSLPDGFAYKDSNITGEWDFGDMIRGESKTISYEVVVSEYAETGAYPNTASVQASNSDKYSASAKLEVRIPEVKGKEFIPDLKIEKTADKNVAVAGSYVVFTIRVINAGEADAINLVIEDSLPKGFITATGETSLKADVAILGIGETWEDSFTVYIQSDTPDGSYENKATAYAENHPDKVMATSSVSLGALPHTGNGLFDSKIFVIALIGFIIALFELLRTVIKAKAARIIVFGLICVICLIAVSYPFWPSIDYAVKNDTLPHASSAVLQDKPDSLLIPKIGVDIPIVQGQDESSLEKGAWLMPQTTTPDLMKNTALAAHRYKYRPPSKETFYLLDKLSEGDELLVYWKGVEYRYMVNSVKIVSPDYTEVLADTEKPTLTLITCHPLFSDEYRLVVQGELVI